MEKKNKFIDDDQEPNKRSKGLSIGNSDASIQENKQNQKPVPSLIEKKEEECYFKYLPADCSMLIFTFLDGPSLCMASQVCSDWNTIINRDIYVYKTMCLKLFTPNGNLKTAYDWKSGFRDICLKDQETIKKAKKWQDVQNEIYRLESSTYSLRVDFLYQKGIEKFKESGELLSSYASFHQIFTHSFHLCREYHLLAIQKNSQHSTILCNYGIFLWTVYECYDQVEFYFEKALKLNPKNPQVFKIIAEFFYLIRNMDDRAEQIYLSGKESYPKDASLLASYGIFLLTKRKEIVKGHKIIEKAFVLCKDSPEIIASIVTLLRPFNIENVDSIFQKASQSAPNDPHVNWKYAVFLQQTKNDIQQAKKFYENAFYRNADARQSLLQILCAEGSLKKCEEILKPLNTEDPTCIKSLIYYWFIERYNLNIAEELCLKGLKIAPNHPYFSINYGSILLLQENKRKKGQIFLSTALQNPSIKCFYIARPIIWFLFFFHGSNEKARLIALQKIKKYLCGKNIRNFSENCYFTHNIFKAAEENHPDNLWLIRLVQVFCDQQNISILDSWSKWKKIDSPLTKLNARQKYIECL